MLNSISVLNVGLFIKSKNRMFERNKTSDTVEFRKEIITKQKVKIMKKRILIPTLVALSMFGFNAMAQTETPKTPKQCNNVECTQLGKDVKKFKGGKKFAKASDPFKGINLSEDQKAKLKALREKKAIKMKERMAEIKVEKQKRDSARRAERQIAKREYLQEVKEIIGPDNYVTYLENIVVEQGQSKQAIHKKSKKMKANNGVRPEKPGKKEKKSSK